MDQTKALKLLIKLQETIKTAHLDMGGNHRYSLTVYSHPVICEIKAYLYELEEEGKNGTNDI